MNYDEYIPEGISDLIEEALNNYWNHAYEPGSFTMSVLCNDLEGAVARADSWNKKNLALIVTYVANKAPYGSWGNPELVKDWLNKGHYYQEYQKVRVVDILSH